MAEPHTPMVTGDPLILAWQGWHLQVPRDWNPARLTGTAREGSLIASDLERVRLELNWKRVRNAAKVRLDRVRRIAWSDWRPGDRAGEGILDGRCTTTKEGHVLAMLVSEASDRLVMLKIPGTADGQPDPVARPLLVSLADLAGREQVPWRVYDFAWHVPRACRLVEHQFAAGRMRAVFRYRRASLTFERWALAAGDPTPGGSDGTDVSSSTLEHRDHEVVANESRGTTWWSRLAQGPTWRATWTCPATQRRFRLTATGPEAQDRVSEAVRGVSCHIDSAPDA